MKIAGAFSDHKQLLYVFLQPPLVKQKKKGGGKEEFQLCSLFPLFEELILVKPLEYIKNYALPSNLTPPN